MRSWVGILLFPLFGFRCLTSHPCTSAVLRNTLILGTIRTADSSLLPELVYRARYTRELFLPVRARLLRNQNFSLAERQGFLASLVLARLMHNAGTWDLSCPEHFGAFARPYMSFLRGSIRPPAWRPVSQTLSGAGVCSRELPAAI